MKNIREIVGTVVRGVGARRMDSYWGIIMQ